MKRGGQHIADGGMLLIGRLRKPLKPAELRWWDDLPVIAITGSIVIQGGPNFLSHAETLGADACLRKPIKIADLLGEIERLLRDGRPNRGA